MFYSQYLRLNLHVAATNREVVRAAYKRLSPLGKSPSYRANRHEWLMKMLDQHKKAKRIANMAGVV